MKLPKFDVLLTKIAVHVKRAFGCAPEQKILREYAPKILEIENEENLERLNAQLADTDASLGCAADYYESIKVSNFDEAFMSTMDVTPVEPAKEEIHAFCGDPSVPVDTVESITKAQKPKKKRKPKAKAKK